MAIGFDASPGWDLTEEDGASSATPTARRTQWIPPEEFDEYRLVRQLGKGGMGQVWLARDTLLERPVAVKFIASVEPDAVARERFFIEARAIARLQHPNVAAIHRVGLVDGRPYLVSELIRGQTLADIPAPLPWQKVLRLGVGLARGLAAAHRHGVVHRDIKPANAMLTESGEVKLLDFGLAKLLEAGSEDALVSTAEPIPRPVDVAPSQDETLALLGAQSVRAAAQVPGPDEPTWRSITRPGELLGTPHYIAPEVWQLGGASARSDVYSLGVILFYLSTGRCPHSARSLPELLGAATSRDAPSLAALVSGMDLDFAAIVERCLCRDPAQRFASGDEVREALERLTPEGRLASVPEGNPYRGLQAFQAEHRSLFFGRDAEIRALLERLRSEPFVLVTGDSGVGKSSLCRAGVLPQVASGSLDDQRSWNLLTFVPGKRPLAALTAALAPVLDMEERELAERMIFQPSSVAWELRKRNREGSGLLVYVDQFEELITLSDPDEAAEVSAMLAQLLLLRTDCRLLASVRQDFLTRIAALPGIGEEVNRALYVLRPLTAEAIREAVVGPARVKGVAFESEELIDRLVTSTAGMEGGLPLLQFTLRELWDARDQERQVIPGARLEAMGGVEGALSRHADGVVAALLPAQRQAARHILMRLVTPGRTRARRTERELASDPDTRAALEALVRGRLLVALSSEEGTVYELAHEALIRGWQTLRSWLSREAESHAARHRLEVAAGEWERLGCTHEVLWGSRQLAEASALELPALAPRERAFLKLSHGSLHKRRLAKRAFATVIPVLIALTYAGVRWKTARDLTRRINADLAMAQSAWAEARSKNARVEGLRRDAFAQFDRLEREPGERSWSLALALAAENERGFGNANEWFEKALALDSGRRELRSAFADFLYERALIAERDWRSAQLSELLQRLRVYDDGGERMRRWNAPAHLRIETSPEGAEVLLERYQPDQDGRRSEVKVGLLGRTPLADAELAPGSYRLTLTAPGRAVVRYPVLLRRAERLPIRVSLPVASEIPDGFIYIPPGRFLFGTADDERARVGFFTTVPMHESATGPYLIARTETTYAEYIEYLLSLTPEERSRRRPLIRQTSMLDARSSLELKETAAGDWMLRFQPTTKAYRAGLGERIRYEQRPARELQDWRRFPVSGISAPDAEAYAKWLRESGRVPGARLCTEKEWERAARGADDRPFPHADRLHPDDANYDETYGKAALAFGPDEVGSHPASRTPFGADDMVGNVWEWTRSSLSQGYAARSGGYYHGSITNMVYNRQDPEPTLRDLLVGLRLCASFPPR